MTYPFDRTWWVIDGLMLAGRYPGDVDERTAERGLDALLGHGISAFVNLQEADETNGSGQRFRDYMPVVTHLSEARSLETSFRRFAIKDQRTPSLDLMHQVLDHLDDLLRTGHRPYVHCWGGNGRTGTVIGCWLVRHGRSADEAFAEMAAGRKGRTFTYAAPENESQRQFVREWSRHERRPLANRVIHQTANWFERLTGLRETDPDNVRRGFVVSGGRMTSLANGRSFRHGQLETVSLGELRNAMLARTPAKGTLRFHQHVGDVSDLHRDPRRAGSLFQVASQFNLLEMVHPSVTPEMGVGRYEDDLTQGPACAIAAGGGTIFRNYFVALEGQQGQTAHKQIDCLADIGNALGNDDGRLWTMKNGYALPTDAGLQEVAARLRSMDDDELDSIRSRLRVGVHWDVEVTADGCSHTVSQVYCSALPIAYAGRGLRLQDWEPFATLVLDAAYEATICAGLINAARLSKQPVYLTQLGGGAFGNPQEWILAALQRALRLHRDYELDVCIVSYNRRDASIDEIALD